MGSSNDGPSNPALRLHIGLENVEDLKADLDRGFAALKATAWGVNPPSIFRSWQPATEHNPGFLRKRLATVTTRSP